MLSGVSSSRCGPLVLAAVASAGCAGAKVEVAADRARYPISMSAALPGPDSEVLVLGAELEAVGEISVDERVFGFVFGLTGGTVDISDAVNRGVEESGGEGVVQLEVRLKHCVHNWFFPLTVLAFYPGCEKVHIHGVVVRRTGRVTARSLDD